MEYLYRWRAYLDDGSIINEGEYEEYKSSDFLPKDRVARMEYVHIDGTSPPVSIDINLQEGEVFFREWRHSQKFDMMFRPIDHSICYIMGVKKGGEKIYTVYLYSDGSVVVSTYHEL